MLTNTAVSTSLCNYSCGNQILKINFKSLFRVALQVDTPHGSSTVYVHGFGTDDGYDRYHSQPQTAYGYGHINHKQGYGYGKAGYHGYNSVYSPHHAVHGVGHHGLGLAHHGLGVAHHGVHHGAHHGAHHLPYRPGYGAPQPFVGSGFR